MARRIPHLRVPFGVDRQGSARTVEQDTFTEVAQCVRVLVGTRPGERLVVPGYGLADPTFTVADPGALAEAIHRWEPRADPDVIDVAVDPQDPGRLQVVVHLEE